MAKEHINPGLKKLATSLDDLRPDPNNARSHGGRSIEAIASSLREFGQQKPIIALDDGTVIAGNGTLEAARSLGWSKLAVIRFADAARARAYALADNRTAELSEWDPARLAENLDAIAAEFSGWTPDSFGFSSDDVSTIIAESEAAQIAEAPAEIVEDEAPEVPKTPRTKRGDVWLLGQHRVMCGDSTSSEDVELLMLGRKAELLITDPPYGVSYADKNKFLNAISRGNRIQIEIENDHESPIEMNLFWKQVLSVAHAATSDFASYYVFSPQGGDLMMMMMALQESSWQLKHMLVWVKNNHVLGRCDYNYKHEPIFYGWKQGKTHRFYGSGSSVSVFEFDKPLKNDLHPTMKPVSLISALINNSSRLGELVFDLFLGSGTTLIAAEQLSRVCYGMEISPAYCDVIVQRWQAMTGEQATLEATGEVFAPAA